VVSSAAKTIAVISAGVLAVIAIAVWSNNGPAHHVSLQQPRTAPSEATETDRGTDLGSIDLTAPGARVPVGQAGTFTVKGRDGTTLYLRATMEEIQQPNPAEAAAARAAAGQPASANVYEMPIELSFLGAMKKADGSEKPDPDIALTVADLPEFAIATRPGEDPLASTNTMTTSGCSALPPASTQLHPGALISWCLHAFGGAEAPAPIGGSATADSGPYGASITWMSTKYKSTVVIP
jgi:hypothetical protein